MIYVCERGSLQWAVVVLIRTAPDAVSGVLAPLFQDAITAKIFMDFLHNSTDEEITARLVWFRGDSWDAAKDTVPFRWPKSGLLYPTD